MSNSFDILIGALEVWDAVEIGTLYVEIEDEQQGDTKRRMKAKDYDMSVRRRDKKMRRQQGEVRGGYECEEER